MVKKYDYFLKSVNPICNAKLRELFTKFAIPCVFYECFEYDVDKQEDVKVSTFLYMPDDIDNCANRDEFLDLLEDLAIRYNL